MSGVSWIKLKVGMFDDSKIKYIEGLPERDTIITIWVKLLTLAGKYNEKGYIMLSENLPYNDEMLANEFNRPINSVRLALETFLRLNMIEKDEDVIRIAKWERHQNVEGMEKIRKQTRERVRKHREQKRLGTCNANVTLRNATEEEVEEEKELEREREKEVDKEKEVEKKKVQTAFGFYQLNGFGLLNSHINDEMGMFIDEFEKDGNEIVIASMKIALDRNNISWGYTKGILRNWINAGLNSIDDVRAYEKRILLQRQSRSNNQYQSKEKTPEWLLKQKSGEQTKNDDVSDDFEQRKAALQNEVNEFWQEDK